MYYDTILLSIMGTEWIFVIFLIVVLFFGKNRLPDIARNIGKAVGEYNSTKKRIEYEVKKTYGQANVNVKGPVQTEREKMEMIANSVGVENAQNKSDYELRQLISSRMGIEQKGNSETKTQTDQNSREGMNLKTSSKQEPKANTRYGVQSDNDQKHLPQSLVDHTDTASYYDRTNSKDSDQKRSRGYLKREFAGVM